MKNFRNIRESLYNILPKIREHILKKCCGRFRNWRKIYRIFGKVRRRINFFFFNIMGIIRIF